MITKKKESLDHGIKKEKRKKKKNLKIILQKKIHVRKEAMCIKTQLVNSSL